MLHQSDASAEAEGLLSACGRKMKRDGDTAASSTVPCANATVRYTTEIGTKRTRSLARTASVEPHRAGAGKVGSGEVPRVLNQSALVDNQDVERYRRLRQMFARCGYAGNENGIDDKRSEDNEEEDELVESDEEDVTVLTSGNWITSAYRRVN